MGVRKGDGMRAEAAIKPHDYAHLIGEMQDCEVESGAGREIVMIHMLWKLLRNPPAAKNAKIVGGIQ